MADLIKKIKIKKQDGTFTDYIPIGAEASNVSMNNGKSVQSIIGDVDVDRDGSIAEQLDKYKDYDSGIKTLKADGTEDYVYFYLEDMEDGTYVVKNIGKEYSVLCYPELIKDKTDKTKNIYSYISLYNNDILQLFKVGDNINNDTRIRYIPTKDSKITCFSIKAINAESDGTSYSWNRDYIGLTKDNYSTSSYDTYNCYYLNDKLVNVGAEEDDNFKVNFIKSKNLYNPSYRANDGTINGTGARTENNGVFTMVASANDSYFWGVTDKNSSYSNDIGELYEFKKDSYTISLSNTAFHDNYITYYDENKVSLGFTWFGNSTFTINKSDKTGAKYFTIRFGISFANASPGTTYSTTIQLEEGNQASAYKPFVPSSSMYVDNEKFTETIGVGTSVDSRNRVNVLHSKNLFNGNSFSNRSAFGVTTTFNNSEITFNGTTSGLGDLYPTTYGFYLEAGTYTFKFSRKSGTYTANGGASAIIIKKTDGTKINQFEIGGIVSKPYSFTFTLDSKTQIGIEIFANASNQTFSNLILEVQFEKGSTATTYEPYITPTINVDGEEIYTKGQSNGIIESGSNTNGNYIKFADGTLICTIRKTINIAINTAWGSLYVGDTDTKYTYPIAFVGNDPVVNSTITGYNSAFVMSWAQSNNRLVETDRFALVRGNTASEQEYVLNITAIGKWK